MVVGKAATRLDISNSLVVLLIFFSFSCDLTRISTRTGRKFLAIGSQDAFEFIVNLPRLYDMRLMAHLLF